MLITCPSCKGERRFYRPKPMPSFLPTNAAVSVDSVESTFERELIDCPRCKGTGRAEATDRIPVKQRGRVIGSVPPSFDPVMIKSKSFWYEPRSGDFIRDDESWVASNKLGPGDLEAVPGFAWDRK